MLKLFISVVTLFFSISVYAGDYSVNTGARSQGLGNASVTLKDPFAFYNNIAGISKTDRLKASISCEVPFSLLALKRVTAAALFPIRSFATGLGLSSFGNSNYHEFMAGAGIAHSIQNVSLGVKLNYSEIAITEAAVRRNIVLEMGGITELTKHIHVGASIHNANKIFEGRTNSALPVIMKAGLSYLPSKELRLCIETEKISNYKSKFKAGVEYNMAEKLSLRAGINTGIFSHFFGIGIHNKKITIDYALQSHPYLGISHSMNFILIMK